MRVLKLGSWRAEEKSIAAPVALFYCIANRLQWTGKVELFLYFYSVASLGPGTFTRESEHFILIKE